MKTKKIIGLIFLASFGFLVAAGALAQERKMLPQSPEEIAKGVAEGNIQLPSMEKPDLPGTVDYKNYYKFQSVKLSLEKGKEFYIPGEEINFRGKALNQNDYPIVDGTIFARFGKKNPNYTEEGNYYIDELVVAEKMVLEKNGQKDFNFSWTVPAELAKGDYVVDLFFLVGQQFNLSGLPFTNEIVATTLNFKVEAINEGEIFFEKSTTRVNGKKYNHIGNWPEFSSQEKVEIVQPLKNTNKKEKSVEVTYDLYWWDSLDERNKISSETETVKVPANGVSKLNYTIDEVNDSVYYLRITASSGGQKSIINLRVVSNQKHPRLNYAALSDFPLRKGESATIFSSFHNAGLATAANNVVVSLADRQGKIIAKKEYRGDIISSIRVIEEDFVPEENYDWVEFSSQIRDNDGNAIDSYSVVYDCSLFDNSASCQEIASKKLGKIDDIAGGKDYRIIGILLTLLLILVLTLVFRLRKPISKKNGKNRFLMFLFMIGLGALGQNNLAQGYYNEKQALVEASYTNSHYYSLAVSTSITHRMGMTVGNYTVNVSDPINFQYDPELPFFNESGNFSGSPYGEWCSEEQSCEASAPSGFLFWGNVEYWCKKGNSGCSVKDAAPNLYTMASRDDWYPPNIYNFGIYATAKRVEVSLSSSDPNVISCTGLNCTANQPGTATISANIPAVVGDIWIMDYLKIVSDNEKRLIIPSIGPYQRIDFPSANLAWTITVLPPPTNLPTLTVNKVSDPAGIGIVTSADGQISCLQNCSSYTAAYAVNTPITLNTNHGENVSVSWSSSNVPIVNNCSGDSCSFTMPGNCPSNNCMITVTFGQSIPGLVPIVSLNASPTNVSLNGTTSLTWTTVNNPDRCEASGAWSGSKSATGGTETKGPFGLAGTHTYRLQCFSVSGEPSNIAEEIVRVQACSPNSTYRCDPNCTEDACGDQTGICYNSCNTPVPASNCDDDCRVDCGACQSGRWREVVPD